MYAISHFDFQKIYLYCLIIRTVYRFDLNRVFLIFYTDWPFWRRYRYRYSVDKHGCFSSDTSYRNFSNYLVIFFHVWFGVIDVRPVMTKKDEEKKRLLGKLTFSMLPPYLLSYFMGYSFPKIKSNNAIYQTIRSKYNLKLLFVETIQNA